MSNCVKAVMYERHTVLVSPWRGLTELQSRGDSKFADMKSAMVPGATQGTLTRFRK